MNVSELAAHVPSTELGASMYELMADLFPFCRSITGDGLRETLERIGEIVPLELTGGADRHAGVRLDDAEGVEHPRRLGRRRAAASGSSTSRPRTCTSSTTARRCAAA